MLILYGFGNFRPISRLQTWALERLIAIHVAGDVRWALMALALRSITAAWVFGQGHFVAHSACKRVGRKPMLLTAWWQQGVARVGHR